MSSKTPEANPCRRAYIDHQHGPNKDRESWDPATTLVAVRGLVAFKDVFTVRGADGRNRVDAKDGTNAWSDQGHDAKQCYLELSGVDDAGRAKSAEAVKDAIDDLLTRKPRCDGSSISSLDWY